MAEQDRRSHRRVPFIAQAELTEEGSGVSIPVRVSDISNEGCYVDLRAPLPAGTLVRIKVVAATDVLEADAAVAYSDPHLGMGLVFRNVSPRDRTVLQKWLWEAEHERQT
jgi:PilZ domain